MLWEDLEGAGGEGGGRGERDGEEKKQKKERKISLKEGKRGLVGNFFVPYEV